MTKLTFYGGVSEIGGNKILLNDRSTSLFLDFGKSFSKEKMYYDEPYLSPRDERQLLALELLPAIPGLYKDSVEDSPIDGVLLSHPHTDHTDNIRFLKDDIPILCPTSTSSIVIGRDLCGRSSLVKYAIAKLTKTNGEEVFKEFTDLVPNQESEIGDTKVKPMSVDHSTRGAFGYIIETEGGSIVYTGDFRLHGIRSEDTRAFIENAKDSDPSALVIEGTNIVDSKISSEEQVCDRIGHVVSGSEKLILAGFSIIDFDRLRSFYDVAKANDRKLAIGMKQAFLLNEYLEDGGDVGFTLNDDDLLIFRRQKSTVSAWEGEMMDDLDNIVQSADIKPIQDDIILAATFYDMNEIIDIVPDPGTIYILSQSEPFNEEMEIDFNKLLNWLDRYGIPMYHIHCSGHASASELKQMVNEISPRKVFVVHTERPGLYKRFLDDTGVEVVMPEYARAYEI